MSEYQQTVRKCDHCGKEQTFQHNIIGAPMGQSSWVRLTEHHNFGLTHQAVIKDFCSDECLIAYVENRSKGKC